ncbi:MAG TPA: hypothetical protein VJ720_07550, partial [Chitinophaga sp.]|nr:hypothetical protein [Chitinophaga sp.]
MKRKPTAMLLLIPVFIHCSMAYAQLKNFPQNSSPEEVGKRVVARFFASPHPNFGRPTPPSVITYPEVCTWYGALAFVKENKDKTLTAKLAERFEPLFSTDTGLVPEPDHVDHTVFGAVPLELYQQLKDPRYLEMGKRIADKQWGSPEGPHVKPASFVYYKQGLTWQTRMWI